MWQSDKRLYPTEQELHETREFERTRTEEREKRRRNSRKMRVHGAGVRTTYRNAVLKRAGGKKG